MAAVVRQKEADGFEVVATYFDAHLDGDCALDLEGKPAPSTEGGAGAPALRPQCFGSVTASKLAHQV